jgi:predicted O-methyltransferase YrrM
MPVSPESIQQCLNRVYASNVVLGDDGNYHSIYQTSVTRARGEFIRDVCLRTAATSTLEIGMAWGLSTLFILEALLSNGAKAASHVVIDPLQFSKFHGAGLSLIREVGGTELITFFEEPSQLRLPKLVSEGRQFDLAFIDGDHKFDGVFVDFFFIHKLLKPGGTVIFDDFWFDPVYLTCRFAELNYGYSLLSERPLRKLKPRLRHKFRLRRKRKRAHIRAYIKPTDEMTRDWRHFEPFFD